MYVCMYMSTVESLIRTTSVNRTRYACHAPLLRSPRVYIRCALIRCITCYTRAIDSRWLLLVLILLPLERKGRELCRPLKIQCKLKICDLVKNGRSLTSVAAEFTYPNISLIRTPSVPTRSDK